MAIPNQGFKTCTGCKAEKPMEDFYVGRQKRSNGTYQLYRQPECKECCILRANIYRAPRKAEINAKGRIYSRKVRANTKALTFAAYGGYECKCCGETEKAFLTIDHINNDG